MAQVQRPACAFLQIGDGTLKVNSLGIFRVSSKNADKELYFSEKAAFVSVSQQNGTITAILRCIQDKPLPSQSLLVNQGVGSAHFKKIDRGIECNSTGQNGQKYTRRFEVVTEGSLHLDMIKFSAVEEDINSIKFSFQSAHLGNGDIKIDVVSLERFPTLEIKQGLESSEAIKFQNAGSDWQLPPFQELLPVQGMKKATSYLFNTLATAYNEGRMQQEQRNKKVTFNPNLVQVQGIISMTEADDESESELDLALKDFESLDKDVLKKLIKTAEGLEESEDEEEEEASDSEADEEETDENDYEEEGGLLGELLEELLEEDEEMDME